jgi:hypothetical protein
MALIFPLQNFAAVPYKGALTAINVALLTAGGIMTNDGQQVQPGRQSKVVNATMDWLVTYRTQAVAINLQSSNVAGGVLNKLLMVYVDNELNSQNVTIYFPDTQQFIGVPAFTTGYYPVLTGNQYCNVYNGTTGAVPVTSSSVTSILFCNFAIPGFLSQETLNITVNSSSGPVVPTIGDKVVVVTLPGSVTPVSQITVLPTVALPRQYVITGIELNAQKLFLDGSGTSGSSFPLLLEIVDQVNNVFIREWNIAMQMSFENTAFFNFNEETGLNIPVNNLVLFSLNLTASAQVILPTWSNVSLSITYALVTL